MHWQPMQWSEIWINMFLLPSFTELSGSSILNKLQWLNRLIWASIEVIQPARGKKNMNKSLFDIKSLVLDIFFSDKILTVSLL